MGTRSDSGQVASHGNWTVSVIVPCLNEAGSIGQLLDAIQAQDTPILDVIVVDGGSSDNTAAILRNYQESNPALPLHVLARPGKTLPEAINIGVEIAQGEVIVRLDAHSRPTSTYVRQSVEALQQTGAGVVGGVWIIAPGNSSATAQSIARAVAHPLGAGDAAYRIGHARTGRQPADTVPFGCFRKVTWERLGRFNETLLTNEDYEFNYRARMAHLPVILDADIRCIYVARSNLTDLAAQYFRYGWWKACMLKQHPRSLRWRQAVPAGFVAALVGLGFLSLVWHPAFLALLGLAALYAFALIGTSLRMHGKVRNLQVTILLPTAFMTVHLSWGTGALLNLLTFGRWPVWGTTR